MLAQVNWLLIPDFIWWAELVYTKSRHLNIQAVGSVDENHVVPMGKSLAERLPWRYIFVLITLLVIDALIRTITQPAGLRLNTNFHSAIQLLIIVAIVRYRWSASRLLVSFFPICLFSILIWPEVLYVRLYIRIDDLFMAVIVALMFVDYPRTSLIASNLYVPNKFLIWTLFVAALVATQLNDRLFLSTDKDDGDLDYVYPDISLDIYSDLITVLLAIILLIVVWALRGVIGRFFTFLSRRSGFPHWWLTTLGLLSLIGSFAYFEISRFTFMLPNGLAPISISSFNGLDRYDFLYPIAMLMTALSLVRWSVIAIVVAFGSMLYAAVLYFTGLGLPDEDIKILYWQVQFNYENLFADKLLLSVNPVWDMVTAIKVVMAALIGHLYRQFFTENNGDHQKSRSTLLILLGITLINFLVFPALLFGSINTSFGAEVAFLVGVYWKERGVLIYPLICASIAWSYPDRFQGADMIGYMTLAIPYLLAGCLFSRRNEVFSLKSYLSK